METIPGGGESVTVAILVRAASGQSSVRQAIPPDVLTALFGQDSGKGMQAMVAETVIALQRQLDAGVPVEQIEPPFGGFELGTPRDCVARDTAEVFDVGVRLSAAFGLSNFGRRVHASTASQQAFDDWAERVKIALLQHIPAESTSAVLNDFNVRLKLGRKFVRFGILRKAYAANFGVLRPGNTSGDIRSLKVKVFDLQGLKREQILPVDNAEVLVGCPSDAMLEPYSKREIESFHQSVEYIDTEARVRGVRLVKLESASRAAEHVASALQAA